MQTLSTKIADLMLSTDKENHALADTLLIGQTADLDDAQIKTLCVDICNHFYRGAGVDEFLTNIEQYAHAENDRMFEDMELPLLPWIDCKKRFNGHKIFGGGVYVSILFRFAKRKFQRRNSKEVHAFFKTNLKNKTNIKKFALWGSVYIDGKTKTLKPIQQAFPLFVEKATKKLYFLVLSLKAFEVGQYVKAKGIENAPAWKITEVSPYTAELVAEAPNNCTGQTMCNSFDYSEVELTDAPTANYK